MKIRPTTTAFWLFLFLSAANSHAYQASCLQLLGGSTASAQIQVYIQQLTNLTESYKSGIQARADLEAATSASLITEGHEKFVSNRDFVFSGTMKRVKTSGVEHEAAFRAVHNGRKLFIKQISTSLKSDMQLSMATLDVLHAKILNSLGLGPRTDLVFIKGSYYIVMDEVSGINIKETLHPEWRKKTNTRKEIDKMLGVETKSMKQSLQLFSRAILHSDEYMNRLTDIVQILEDAGYHSTDDLQFMIDLSVGPSSIQIIDTDSFERSDEPIPGSSDASPTHTMREILDRLAELAL